MQRDHLTSGVPQKLPSKDLLQWDQTLFKDERYFELDYIPEHFSHRDTQMRALKIAARPALRGARANQLSVFWPHGTGKTTAVLKVFEEIENYTDSVVPVYVNCQIDSTRFAIFSEIYKKLFKYTPPDSGVHSSASSRRSPNISSIRRRCSLSRLMISTICSMRTR